MSGFALIQKEEVAFLAQHVVQGGLFVEIGTYCAATIATLARRFPRTLFVSIDPYEDHHDPNVFSGTKQLNHSLRNWQTATNRNLLLMVGFSARLKRLLGPGSVDACFIDGDHSFKGCLADLKLMVALLKPEGCMLVHDYCATYPGVVQAVDTFCLSQGRFVVRAREKKLLALQQGPLYCPSKE